MKPSKVIYNKDTRAVSGAPASGKQNEAPLVAKMSSINDCCFSPNSKFYKQLATVDEGGRLIIWDQTKGTKIIEDPNVTNSPLNICTIDREGKLVACGGIDMKIHIFGINKQGNRREKVKSIERVKELTGHSGDITSACFLNNQFLVSGSNDSTILLWDLENPSRFIVKYI